MFVKLLTNLITLCRLKTAYVHVSSFSWHLMAPILYRIFFYGSIQRNVILITNHITKVLKPKVNIFRYIEFPLQQNNVTGSNKYYDTFTKSWESSTKKQTKAFSRKSWIYIHTDRTFLVNTTTEIVISYISIKTAEEQFFA